MRLNGIRIEDAGNTTLLDYDYTHDSVSNIVTKVTEHGNYRYGYDKVSRLTVVSNPPSAGSGQGLDDESYSYDGVGNRVSASGVSGTISHNQNNELESYGDISYEYDDNGNMVRKSVGAIAERYVYNVANRLTRIEDEGTGSLIAEYYYDPFGRRLWKEVDGARTYFFYSDEGLVAEYDSSGNELRAYGYTPNSTWTTNPLFLKQDDEYFFYQNDHLGTPQKLVDESGIVVWSATYTAFGEAFIDIETVLNNFRFPGQYYDVETGLHYNLNRYYDSESSHYTQVDPIGFLGNDTNLYAFVGNNPSTKIDPYGLFVIASYHRKLHTLTVTDIDTREQVMTRNIFSGNKYANNPHYDWVEERGPLPDGIYLIGTERENNACNLEHSGGNCGWYRLYGPDGNEGYSYTQIPVNDPYGNTVVRGRFNLHTGRRSNGCLTVISDVGENDPRYPDSDIYDHIQDILNTTKPLQYNGSDFSGYLIVY